jgi:mRNA interferase MazF
VKVTDTEVRVTEFEPIMCVAYDCTGPACPDRVCWLREGYRLAVDVAKEAVDEGVPGWLPNRMCEVAADMVCNWQDAGAQYTPVPEHYAAVSRGEVWTATGGVYAGKPRPVVVLQDGAFGTIGSVTICPMTTLSADTPLRVPVESSEVNGLKQSGYVMVDKITTVPRVKVHNRLGVVSDEVWARIEKVLLVYLFGVR